MPFIRLKKVNKGFKMLRLLDVNLNEVTEILELYLLQYNKLGKENALNTSFEIKELIRKAIMESRVKELNK